MQYNRPPDRRPMSAGNKLVILVAVLVIFGAGAVSILLNNRGGPDRLQDIETGDLTANVPSVADGQNQLPSVQDMQVTEASEQPEPSEAPVVFVSPEPEPTGTPEPNFYMTPTPTEVPTLKLNSSGDEVRAMQQRLIKLGYMKEGADDAQFGKGTQNAVKAFQAANGLGADGAAGPKTLTLLFSDQAKEKPQ